VIGYGVKTIGLSVPYLVTVAGILLGNRNTKFLGSWFWISLRIGLKIGAGAAVVDGNLPNKPVAKIVKLSIKGNSDRSFIPTIDPAQGSSLQNPKLRNQES